MERMEWVAWVVNLKAVAGEGEVKLEDPERRETVLADRLGEHEPIVRCHPDSYVVHIAVRAKDPPSAAARGYSLIRKAAGAVELPAWPVVRMEIMRPGGDDR